MSSFLRIVTAMASISWCHSSSATFGLEPAIAKNLLCFLQSSLQIAYRIHLGQLDAERDERLCDVRAEARDDHMGAHQSRRRYGLQEVIRDLGVNRRNAGHVKADDLSVIAA